MAHFIAFAKGRRHHHEVHRLGDRDGATARAQGWTIGGIVQVYEQDGYDYVELGLNGGSQACSLESAEPSIQVWRRKDAGDIERVR